ncbi:putative Mg2+ transporter protein, CorA-like/Zinc transport protein ZntB [Helianthus annuus]|uniref:Mg2+ transporter protein, CorA-like/Zinc transport protein ZntB n=1 Tax=Helianthus annuus TaxID=4232 RepID=A0A251UQ44_HELAN|nr:putative Mg2+ transporter protein, CorA-like/Zinc transport protein ZntB [Helianthus annuus]KAJ0584682.1 putative Mg2+ transporter protein, CorA-like/Zinc transport protein ZntB [Helianthus annuus]KAJ0750349.1 putative Mg2+ transporter protein, CorA-like/Zinc transport protein ZntB [Helianthus annuus]KAJ0922866.1 putative Mg2+ transporter protein, CorA-like/Zinc transport protein ZntB [Helianthus annuus]
MKKFNNQKHQAGKDATVDCAMWTDGLICAFEAKRSHKKCRPQDIIGWKKQGFKTGIDNLDEPRVNDNIYTTNYWVPIGWSRINQLVETIQVDGCWEAQHTEFQISDNEVTVADIAAPYWERPGGPTWWCHVDAGHPSVTMWLSNSKWLHPAISIALRDESKLISERMKHLLYEVPVRVAGGLLFELLGQSAGDPYVEEDDIPVVLRSWQAQNFLVTALHVKGDATNINVLGVSEVQELLAAGGSSLPQTIHEVIALLACRLARWDDRLFRKYIFGAADEVELKFMNRRNHEDLHLFSIILNQEIRRLSSQVIRVKWSLHAREEIVFELLQHLKGNTAKYLLEGITKSTRQMIEEQEAVRGRLFTVQDVMQSTVRAWLQDKSLRVTHNLGVFGGCGLVLSIITGLFGINVDGIPGSENSPFAFLLFSCILALLGIILIFIGLLYLGLKNPAMEEEVEVRKLELQEIVKMFQQEAESHAQLRKSDSKNQMPPVPASTMLPGGNTNDSYVLMHSEHD